MDANALVRGLLAGTVDLEYPMPVVERLIADHGMNMLAWDMELANPTVLCTLVWAGLLHVAPDVPLDAVKAALRLRDVPVLTERLNAAMGVGANPTSDAPAS